MITRREVLAALAAIPVVALAAEALAGTGISSSKTIQVDLPPPGMPPFVEALDVESLAPSFDVRRLTPAMRDQIWSNRGSGNAGPLPPELQERLEIEKKIFYSMCRHLRIPEGIRTAIMTSPVGLFQHPKSGEPLMLMAYRRRLSLGWGPATYDGPLSSVKEDAASCLFDTIGQLCADDIHEEMVADLKTVEAPMLYAFYTPLFIGDTDPGQTLPSLIYRYSKKA